MLQRLSCYHRFLFTPLCEGLLCSAQYSSVYSCFYSHPSARGYSILWRKLHRRSWFLFTPLCEGLPAFVAYMQYIHMFLFTPLCEGLRQISVSQHHLLRFYSRPSARGYILMHQMVIEEKSFYSRPSARGYKCCFICFGNSLVSIHAPLRGATGLSFVARFLYSVSIHAPLRGATGGQARPRRIRLVMLEYK